MTVFSKSYLRQVVETQGELFDMFARRYPNCARTILSFRTCAGELVWRDNYTLKFSAEEMAGLSAKLDKVISSDAATLHNLAGDGN